MEKPQPLCIQSGVYEAHARGIATGVVEAGHKAEANWVSARQEYNWNGRGCSFCRDRRGSVPDDDGHRPLHEFIHQSWQAFVMSAGQVIFNRPILPLDEANLLQAPFEGLYIECRYGARCACKHEPDDRHGLLTRLVTGHAVAPTITDMKSRLLIAAPRFRTRYCTDTI